MQIMSAYLHISKTKCFSLRQWKLAAAIKLKRSADARTVLVCCVWKGLQWNQWARIAVGELFFSLAIRQLAVIWKCDVQCELVQIFPMPQILHSLTINSLIVSPFLAAPHSPFSLDLSRAFTVSLMHHCVSIIIMYHYYSFYFTSVCHHVFHRSALRSSSSAMTLTSFRRCRFIWPSYSSCYLLNKM